MTLPGTNYNIKPYVDDSSSLPTNGTTIQSLSDTAVIMGQVTASAAGPPRTVTYNGWQSVLVLMSSTSQKQWNFTTLSGITDVWSNYTLATAGASVFWLGRSST